MGRQRLGHKEPRTARSSPALGRVLPVLLVVLTLQKVDAGCTGGFLKLDLLSTSGGAGCDGSLHALCLPSLRVGVAANCSVALTPLPLSGGVASVPGIWSSNPGSTYTRPLGCPAATTAGVDPEGGSSPTPAQLRAAVQLALERHVYGAAHQLGIASLAWANGTLTATTTTGTCALKYAITQVSPASGSYAEQLGADAVPAQCDVEGVLLDGGECQMNLADSCAPGRRPVELPLGGKACALCRAGTYSGTGTGCAACAAGKYAGSVGASSCSPCAAGTFAPGGNSACVPCSPGTYQGAQGKAACDPCPYRSYARLPGATLCVRCVAGVARCVTGSAGGCNSSYAEAPSPGYQVLSVTAAGTLPAADCALGPQLAFASPPLFGRCSLAPPGATLLSLYVDQYCGAVLTPMSDPQCAEPGASYWPSMRIAAHFVTPTLIATRFNPAATSPTSSYLLSLTPAGPDTLTLSYWPATTDPTQAALVSGSSQVCTGTATVVGGQVAGVPATPTACPPGSYDDSQDEDGCRPCPEGSGCDLNAISPTPCPADHYQPYLGGSQASCQACNASEDPRHTANAGDAYCLVPWVDTECSHGYEYDDATTTCSICAAGTQRRVGREAACVACPPGHYSPLGAADCLPCPFNQFAPSYGLAERSTGVQKCYFCPVGAVALSGAGATGQTASVSCDACPPGTVAAITPPLLYATCKNCSDGYYRPGFASFSNNVCKQIPAGQREVSRASAAYPRAQVQACSKGEVSSWAAATRSPADPQECQPCLGDNTYAPRTGMSSCRPCRGGTAPGKSNSSLAGNDQCVACTGNTYRAASSTSPTCLVCFAGREVHGSGSACVPCMPGYYMPDVDGGTNTSKPAAGEACLPCEANSHQPLVGQARCQYCAAGHSTEDAGNTHCVPCAYGFYSQFPASPCVPAPKGTFVNTTGATRYTPCAPGTFSDQVAADQCDACGPGQYANGQGFSACKTCPAGTYSGGHATTCQRCPPGFSAPSGSGGCSPCKPGSFSSGWGAQTCPLCPLGNQCPGLATTDPQPCPRGQFNNKQGARICSQCPEDTFSDTTGQRGCKTCARGYFTRGLTGQSACQAMRNNVATASVRRRRWLL